MKKIENIARITILVAGLIHLAISSTHLQHAFAHGVIFFSLGIFQCGWAVLDWRRPSRLTYRIGLAASGGVFILWILTQLISTPFAAAAEPIDLATVASKIFELAGFLLLGLSAMKGILEHLPQLAHKKLIAEAAIVAIFFGLFAWGGGHIAEAAMPELNNVHLHLDAISNSDDQLIHLHEEAESHSHEHADDSH